MSEIVELTATRDLGHANDVRLKALRRELTRLAKVVPDNAIIRIENVGRVENGPLYWRRLVARWTVWV